MKHQKGAAKGCISGQGDRLAVCTVQYQQHLKDMAAGYTVEAQKFRSKHGPGMFEKGYSCTINM